MSNCSPLFLFFAFFLYSTFAKPRCRHSHVDAAACPRPCLHAAPRLPRAPGAPTDAERTAMLADGAPDTHALSKHLQRPRCCPLYTSLVGASAPQTSKRQTQKHMLERRGAEKDATRSQTTTPSSRPQTRTTNTTHLTLVPLTLTLAPTRPTTHPQTPG